MKKYVLGFFALAVIVVLSAFTISSGNKKDPTLFYFYEVDASEEINPSAPLNDGDPMTFQEFLLVNPVDCPNGNDADCIRAWDYTYTPTATELSDDVIRKDLQ